MKKEIIVTTAEIDLMVRVFGYSEEEAIEALVKSKVKKQMEEKVEHETD